MSDTLKLTVNTHRIFSHFGEKYAKITYSALKPIFTLVVDVITFYTHNPIFEHFLKNDNSKLKRLQLLNPMVYIHNSGLV